MRIPDHLILTLEQLSKQTGCQPDLSISGAYACPANRVIIMYYLLHPAFFDKDTKAL
jgi:hypothetical protein